MRVAPQPRGSSRVQQLPHASLRHHRHRRRRRCWPPPRPASAQSVVSTPSTKTLYKTGPTGRYLMDGTWLFKLDNHQSGPAARVRASPAGSRSRSPTPGTSATTARSRSSAASAGIARTSSCPTAAKAASWVVRFESVNYRSKIWLNGKPIGKNRGAYLPFEIRLPAGLLKRGGVNRPGHPGRLAAQADRLPALRACRSWASRRAAGGTTAACCARSTCARSTTSTSTRSSCAPICPCATCQATVTYRVTLRNYGSSARAACASARGSAVAGRHRHALRSAPSASPR